ncbi:MAG: oxidoreductase [Actinomycetota bacterium]
MSWSTTDIPPQDGRRVLVTGATSGIGLEAAKALAARGAHVLLGARDQGRGDAARAQVVAAAPTAHVDVIDLDVADLASVERAAERVVAEHGRLDVLVNNAGVMATPLRRTADGFELQLGTNHFGHFALTARLLPALEAASSPRVVTVSSGAHRMGTIDFDDLDAHRRYRKWAAYGQSKLANLLFTFELQRRAEDGGSPLAALACHPGFASTKLQSAGPRMAGQTLRAGLTESATRLLGQSAAAGALPTLYAATAPEARGGDYIGPSGPGEMRGAPTTVTPSAAARDAEVARRLWEVSEERTGVRFQFTTAIERQDRG